MNRATGRMVGMAAGLIFLAILPSQMSNAGEPSPALTLTEAGSWTPEASLDTAQVEAPEVPADEQYSDEFGQTLGEGWQPVADPIPDETGVEHTDCWINVGDTSVIVCADGYLTLS